jgi:hypothetical protein
LIALLYQPGEYLPHSGKVRNPLIDERHLASGQHPRLRARARLIQRQESANFGQREAQRLRPLYETRLLRLFCPMVPMPAEMIL